MTPTIAIVSDNLMVQLQLRQVASAAGLETIVIDSIDALHRLPSEKAADELLVLIDMAADRFSPFDVAEHLTAAAPQVRLVGVGTLYDLDHVRRAKLAGIKHVVSAEKATELVRAIATRDNPA